MAPVYDRDGFRQFRSAAGYVGWVSEDVPADMRATVEMVVDIFGKGAERMCSGRATYQSREWSCALDPWHEGDHRWPRDGSIVTWPNQ